MTVPTRPPAVPAVVPRMSRRALATGLGVLPAALGLAACGGPPATRDGAPQAAPGGGGRLPPGTTLVYLGNHNQAEAQVVLPQLDAFGRRFPGALATATIVRDGYDEKLQSLLAAGSPPDLFRTGGTGWPQLANQGAMAEIGGRITRDKYDLTDFIDAAVGQYAWRGKQLGLGSNVGYTLLYYNTALFAAAGVAAPGDDWGAPWTWERFGESLKRLTVRSPEGGTQTFGFTDLAEYHRLLVTNGVRLTDEDETRTMYDSPEAIEAWEWLYDLVHGQQVAQNPLTHRELSPADAFLRGQAATWVKSTATGSTQLVARPDLSWDVAPTPRGPRLKSDKWIWGGGSAWWIASGSKQPDATWELMKHLQSPESGRALAAGGFAPIRASVLNSPAWLRSDQPPKSKRALVDGLTRLLPFPKLTNWTAVNDAIDQEVQALWRGERRGREVALRIRQATDPLLAAHQQALRSGR